ncbi:hypothetical protein PGB90_010430 [Kerria lacca]
MKNILAYLLLAAVVTLIQADTSSPPTADELIKKVTDGLEEASKSFEKLTGLKAEYDKEKVKEYLKKAATNVEEAFKKAKEFFESNTKNLPEDAKKKIDELYKQVQEQIKNLNSPEVQKSAQKFQESVNESVKKLAAAQSEFLKSLGVAVPPNFQKTFNEIYDELVKTGDKLKEKFSKLVEDAQAELKKKKN